MILTLVIGCVTLFFLFVRPYNLSIGIPPTIGALLCILTRLSTFSDLEVVFNLVWNPTLAFLGILILSLFFESIGLFEILAQYSIRLSRGKSSLLFINSIIFTALTAAVFANDGAIMIITPLLLTKMRMLALPTKTIIAFLMMGNIVSDTASLPLLISNLVNILAGEFIGITFVSYFTSMVIPYVVSVIFGGLFLYLYYRKDLPKSPLNIETQPSIVKDPLLLYSSVAILILLIFICFISGIYQIPLSFLIIPTAVILIAIGKLRKQVNVSYFVKQTPWSVVAFSIGMYIIIYTGYTHGLFAFIAPLTRAVIDYSVYGGVLFLGFFSAIFSCIVNNLPALLIQMLSLKSLQPEQYKLFTLAIITGCDIGSKILPTGSLATLIWLHQLKRHHVNITWSSFIKTCAVMIPPLLFIVLSVLNLTYWIRGG